MVPKSGSIITVNHIYGTEGIGGFGSIPLQATPEDMNGNGERAERPVPLFDAVQIDTNSIDNASAADNTSASVETGSKRHNNVEIPPPRGPGETDMTATPAQQQLLLDEYTWLQETCRYISPEYGDDLAQVAAMKFLTHAHTIHFPDGKIRGWLHTVAKNAFRDMHRRQGRTVPEGEIERLDFLQQQSTARRNREEAVDILVDEMTDNENIRRLYELLPELYEGHAKLLEDLYFSGLSDRELREKYNLAPNTFAARKSRALSVLRSSFNNIRSASPGTQETAVE